MSRYALALCYFGGRFHGWQVQKNAVTVQQTLQNAFETTFGFRPDVSGCSRTDSGVHALHYVCHTDLPTETVPPEKLPLALNASLHGSGLAVKRALAVPDDFHARYSARGKRYEYRIWNAPYADPFSEGRALHFPKRIDETKLAFFAEEITGKHDFRAFMADGGKEIADTTRTVTDFHTVRSGDLLTLSVSADGFLYNMVRIIAGTYLAAALGSVGKGDVTRILLGRDRASAGDTAPACALYLTDVFYDEPLYSRLHGKNP